MDAGGAVTDVRKNQGNLLKAAENTQHIFQVIQNIRISNTFVDPKTFRPTGIPIGTQDSVMILIPRQ